MTGEYSQSYNYYLKAIRYSKYNAEIINKAINTFEMVDENDYSNKIIKEVNKITPFQSSIKISEVKKSNFLKPNIKRNKKDLLKGDDNNNEIEDLIEWASVHNTKMNKIQIIIEPNLNRYLVASNNIQVILNFIKARRNHY